MEIIIFLFVFAFGLILGSFLNCLIWRLHEDESLGGRSHCPKCLAKIHWYDNIPVLSFFVLRGKCRNCQESISWQYPIVEFFSALLFLFSFLIAVLSDKSSFDLIILLLRNWVFIFILIIIFISDFRWREVPMNALWPATVLIFILNLLLGDNLGSLLLSSAIGASFFLIQYLATKKRGIGEGDIWIGLMLGAMFSDLWNLALAIFAAYMIGSVLAIYLLLSKKKEMKSKVALGPLLVIGALISLFFGGVIIAWYKGLFIL